MKKLIVSIFIFFISIVLWAQKPHIYPLTPVPSSSVTITDKFWKPKQEVAFGSMMDWVTYNFDRENGGYKTFRESKQRDTVKVEPVTSFESIKVLEAAGEYLKYNENPDMEDYMDRCIDHWVLSQDKTGYFSGICLGDAQPKGRWNNLTWSHEMYGIGHLLDAALSYSEATGKDKILKAALRSVEQLMAIFGPDKVHDVDGHEGVERALTRYYAATGDKRFLDLARFFVDERGRDLDTRYSLGEYCQDHIPFEKQHKVVGHAVRASYYYIGATDVAAADNNKEYFTSIDSLWKDMTERQMYNTGAVGVISANNEGYKNDYEIAPDDCYGESCAAIANCVWAHRLNRLYADASYMDYFEKIAYNAFLSAMALDGQGIYYCNHVNCHAPETRAWPNCPCCPGNIMTHYASMPGYMYSTSEKGVYVNLFINSVADIDFASGVKLSQTTDYPWDGKIALSVEPKQSETFRIFIRIPQWADNYSIKLNGKKVDPEIEKGYAVLEKTWKGGDKVELNLPMVPKREYMPKEFTSYKGLVALKRGPIVYTFEGLDNYGAVCNLQLPAKSTLHSVKKEILDGIVEIEATGKVLDWDGKWISCKITAIPCGLHSNRGTSYHYGWIAEDAKHVKEPSFHLSQLDLAPKQ